jgi:hydrogenase maturation protein HypF
VVNYEGQAAIELEALASPDESGYYEFDLHDRQIDPAPLWQALISDWRKGVSRPVLSARFHNSVAAVTLQLCHQIRGKQDATTLP